MRTNNATNENRYNSKILKVRLDSSLWNNRDNSKEVSKLFENISLWKVGWTSAAWNMWLS